jgi:multidrug transporter EmrE-like cation transporter
MYTRYMAIAFLTNGMGAFGLRVLAGLGLAEDHSLPYLAIWYLAGLLLAGAVYARRLGAPRAKEAAIGGGMALCSLAGQLGMALALAGRLPGFVVFPVATGGGLLLVVLVGVAVFGERMRPLGYFGTAVGVLALVLLAAPE